MARIVDWETFFASAAGRTVAAWERGAYARFVAAKRGDRALQIGFAADLDPLEKSPIAHRIALSEDVVAIARDDLRLQVLGVSWALPFENESCDIVALPHGLDLHPDKLDATLEEVYRVLAPNGLFVTTFFNSIGSWKLRELFLRSSHILPEHSAAVSMSAIKSATVHAGFRLEGGNFGVYAVDRSAKPEAGPSPRLPSWIDKAGDRWWPTLSNVVLLSARKVTSGMTLVGKVNFAAAKAPARAHAAVQNRRESTDAAGGACPHDAA